MKPDGRSKSAAELMAELASDPAHRAMQQRRATERLQVEAQLASAEQPLLEARGQQGVRLFSVWELVNSAQTPAALIPTLCEHLAELSTTQIYTQVSIRKLKEIHTATHPGAKLERAAQRAGVEDLAADAGDVAAHQELHDVQPPATRAALLSSSAAETAEEEPEEAGG